MDECMDYWGELYDSQSDEDVERYYNTLLKKWNQSFTTYKRTPFEKSLHKFNSENSINKKHTTISNHKEVN